jgi:Flp pilus assembly protein TadD
VYLADALVKAGNTAEAEQVLRAGLANDPRSPELNFTLGTLLKNLGHDAEADKLLERAAELGLSIKPAN